MTTKLKAIQNVNHDGTVYAPGDDLPAMPEGAAAALIAAGAAVAVEPEPETETKGKGRAA